jgi:hypothetical protein
MDIGEVLSRAWQIIWRHKVLWIFGILAGCSAGNRGPSFNYDYSNRGDLPPAIQRFFTETPPEQLILLGVAALAVILVLVVLTIFLGTIGRIGLIRGTQQVDQGAERLAFGELFRGSTHYFWRVFLLSLIIGLAVFAVVMILVVLGIAFSVLTFGIGAICLIPLVCVLVPVGIFVGAIIGLVVELANNAMVVENLGIMDGLRRGWEITKANAGTIAVMWLILVLGISLIGGFIIGLPFLLIAAPAMFALIAGNDRAFQGGLIISLICLVAYLPVLIVLSGILRSYVQSAWTLTFLRLTAPKQALVAPATEPVM